MAWTYGFTDFAPLPQRSSFRQLQSEVNRLFGNLLEDYNPARGGAWEERFSGFSPKLRLSQDEKSLTVEAELPGMSEKEVEISLTTDSLTLRGEKRMEREEKGARDSFYSECSYGAFERTIPLNFEVDEDKVEATFAKGVLKIVLPKSANTRSGTKKISVRAA